MPRFLSRLALRLRPDKRADGAPTSKPDAASLPPVASADADVHVDRLREPVRVIDEAGKAHESAASSAARVTVMATRSSTSSPPLETPVTEASSRLEALPAELRSCILWHLTDNLAALKDLGLASPVYYHQYRLDRPGLLRAALKTALGSSLVDAYAVQTSSRLYDSAAASPEARVQPDTIRLVLDNYALWRLSVPADAILEEWCTEGDLLDMAALLSSIIRPLAWECAERFLPRLDPALQVGTLSATEETRLVRALYRWQLYCNLFGQGPSGSRKVPQLSSEEHLDVFFCIFKPWEVEEIYCLYLLLKDFYNGVLDTIAWDLHPDHPKFHGWPNPFPPGSCDLKRPFVREWLVDGTMMRGLLVFADIVREDEHDELVELMELYMIYGYGDIEQTLCSDSQFSRRQRHPLEGDRMERRRERLAFSGDVEDGPPLSWVIYWRGRYRNRYAGSIVARLQTWGHVFWDRKRLININGTKEVLRERDNHN